MKYINSITNSPNQNIIFILDDGRRINITLKYIDNQNGWFYSLIFGSFTVNNRRIVTSPNMLRQFRNVIDFGLCCIVSDGNEPLFLDDFISKRAKLYLLDSDDVVSVEGMIQNAQI